MLALMVPASACCLGSKLAANHECGCCADDGPDAPARPEVCPSDTIAHSQMPAAVTMPEMQMVELVEAIQAWMRFHVVALREAAPLPSPSTAPPELRTTWVFVSRAALPARAPSERV